MARDFIPFASLIRNKNLIDHKPYCMIVTEEQKKEAHAFYREALDLLEESGAQFMLGGAFAMFHYSGIFGILKKFYESPSSFSFIVDNYFCHRWFFSYKDNNLWL